MVNVLVILDGAADRGPTSSLRLARTPALDLLATEGQVRHRQTIPSGLPAGSEVGISMLLGLPVLEAPSRGAIEAAAAGVDVPAGEAAWRIDAPRESDLSAAHDVARSLRLAHLRGHRFLAIGAPPVVPAGWRLWPEGAPIEGSLDQATVIIGGPGVAIGIGRLTGATTVVPDGCTADMDTDLLAKSGATIDALKWAERVVVHVAAADEAAHRRDPAMKVRLLESIDREVIAPLHGALVERDATLEVAIDHGTDPTTGEHLADPVPFLRWGTAILADDSTRFVEQDALLEEAS